MSLEKLNFTKNWQNFNDFPTYESSESQVREDMQFLFDEIKNYINGTLTEAVDTLSTTVDEAVATAMKKAAGPENILTGDIYLSKSKPHIILIDETDPDARKIVEIGVADDGKLRFNLHPEGAGSLGGLVFQNEAENFNQSIQLFENPTVAGESAKYWTFLTNRNTPSVAQAIYGMYKGTGEYGASHATSLPVAIPFTPKLVMIWDTSGAATLVYPFIPGGTADYKLAGVTQSGSVVYSTDHPNTVSWFHIEDAAKQFNASGVDYCYMVLGNGEVA